MIKDNINKRNINKKIIIIVTVIAILIQIYLVSVQPINVKIINEYDDELIFKQAESILQGKWLGEYNCLTLVKGPIAPLFIAISRIVHIPFLIAQDIFFILACILLVYELKTKIKSLTARCTILIILIFNPIIYSTDLCRIYRDGIFLSLIIYLLAFTIGIFLNRKAKISKLAILQIGLGITLGSICLCREENVWILPYLIISTIITIIYFFKDKEVQNKKIKTFLYMIPVVIVFIMITIIKMLNYKYYGVFELNQYWGREFKEAYGALTRILPEEKIEKVPVTADMLKKAYDISPSFAELKDYFEEETIKWSQSGDGRLDQIQGGYFHWALIRAVESKGYYKDANTANEYYKKIAKEINEACDNKQVESLNYKRVSNVNLFDGNDIVKSIMKCGKTIKFQYKMVLMNIKNSVGCIEKNKETEIKKIEEITLNKTSSAEDVYGSKIDKIKIGILEGIRNVYATINPYIFYESLIVFLAFVGISIYNKANFEKIVILIGLIGIYLCRIFIISFTSITMYTTAVNVMYLSVTYIIQSLFACLVNVFLMEENEERRKKI